MTAREAVIQAHIELGLSRKEAELKPKSSDAFLPDAAILTQSPVKPGMERKFIDSLKEVFEKMDANSEATKTIWQAETGKRAKGN